MKSDDQLSLPGFRPGTGKTRKASFKFCHPELVEGSAPRRFSLSSCHSSCRRSASLNDKICRFRFRHASDSSVAAVVPNGGACRFYCPQAPPLGTAAATEERSSPIQSGSESPHEDAFGFLVPKLHLGTPLSAQLHCPERDRQSSWLQQSCSQMEFGNERTKDQIRLTEFRRLSVPLRPGGTAESSPALQCRVGLPTGPVPEGRLKREVPSQTLVKRPAGTRFLSASIPAINCRATFSRPSGTKIWQRKFILGYRAFDTATAAGGGPT